MKEIKKNEGITLVALIVTIIVMLILVTVTITVAVKGGLFENAGKAVKETNKAVEHEKSLGNGYINGKSIEDIVNARVAKSGESLLPEYYTSKLDSTTGVLIENVEYTDENEDTATIPQGFKILEEAGILIEEGLVIQDANGNEFVWIPVNYTASGTQDEHELDTGFLDVFKRSTTSTNYSEPYASGYTGENTEYYAMMQSVQANHGFYVGRYEAGTTVPRHDNQTNGTTTMVVKRDMYPYNCVGWGAGLDDISSDVEKNLWDEMRENVIGTLNNGHGAVYLSNHLYYGQDVGVTSTLCYGVQWDAMINFIATDETYDTDTDSMSWGNYYNNEFTITRGNYAEWDYDEEDYIWNEENLPLSEENSYTKEENTDVLLTTGASEDNKAKNIYDIAGNCEEWTMEEYYSTDRVLRGGSYTCYGDGYPASFRHNSITHRCDYDYSFRPTLYVKENVGSKR